MSDYTQLLPARHSDSSELFVCDVADAALKDILPQMEYPFYSLSKKPETTVRRYEHNGNWLEITPSVKGLATIYDKDILVYAISQIMAKLKAGEPVSKRVRINTHDCLIFTNRTTDGRSYKAFVEALDRLEGTRIRTNVRRGEDEELKGFGLIDASTVKRKRGKDGRLEYVELDLSDWVFDAIRDQQVLTLHRDYFRLGTPLQKRIYELARKHCGHQPEWKIGLELLKEKVGSKSALRRFRFNVRKIAEADNLPDYHISYEKLKDQVCFKNRGTMPMIEKEGDHGIHWTGHLSPETYGKAREFLNGLDVYALEAEWRNWMPDIPKDPDAAFLGFCLGKVSRK